MAEDVEKRGTIRTMDDDLSRAHGGTDLRMPPKLKENPEAEMASPPPAPVPAPTKPAHMPKEAPAHKNAPVPPAPPTPPRAPKTPYMSDEELDKLLPLEDTPTDATRLSDDMPPGSHESVVRTLPKDHEPMRPAPTPQKPAPAAPSRDLEDEIFPEPEIKKDFTEAPVPTPLGDTPPPNLPTEEGALPTPPPPPAPPSDGEELPAETPEEILGISDEGGAASPPSAMSPAASAPSSSRKIIMGVVALALVAAAAGGGAYYFFSQDEAPPISQEEEEEDQPQEPSSPEPFVVLSGETATTMPALERDALAIGFLSVSVSTFYPEGSLVYIPVSITAEGEGGRFLTAEDVSTVLSPAPDIASVVGAHIMPYLYYPTAEERTLCEQAGIITELCWGPRAGIVFQAQPGRAADLAALSAQWRAVGEAALLDIILSAPGGPATKVYEETQHVTSSGPVTIYYRNYPISTTALDFAVIDDYLVVATSKNATLAILDALAE